MTRIRPTYTKLRNVLSSWCKLLDTAIITINSIQTSFIVKGHITYSCLTFSQKMRTWFLLKQWISFLNVGWTVIQIGSLNWKRQLCGWLIDFTQSPLNVSFCKRWLSVTKIYPSWVRQFSVNWPSFIPFVTPSSFPNYITFHCLASSEKFDYLFIQTKHICMYAVHTVRGEKYVALLHKFNLNPIINILVYLL